MENNVEEDKYYRGRDLMHPNEKKLFQKIKETMQQQTGYIAVILGLKQKNEEKLQIYRKKIEELEANQASATQIKWRKDTYKTLDDTQGHILKALQPAFNETFDKIADDPKLGGIGYNEVSRTNIRLNIILGYRENTGSMDGARDTYRSSSIAKSREKGSNQKIQKNNEKRNIESEKVRLPRDHQLLHEDSYPKLQKTMWTHLDNIVSTYQKKFLRDTKDTNQLQLLIDHYFLFIFLQMLIQSKVVFDTKKPKSNPFFEHVIDDCLIYIQQTYDVSLTISSDIIKKKFFSTIDETTKPLELLYKNCMEEDLIAREEYFNTYFFTSEETSVDGIRRKIMKEHNKNIERMNKGWELLNPLYHIAKDKKEKILRTLEILKEDTTKNILIEDMIDELQKDLEKAEKDIKDTVVFEEDPLQPKDPDSLIKIEQQYLKWYKVPVQYRKIFGVIINRLNNFYQVKANLIKKANKNNNQVFDQLINSDQTSEDILYHINNLITTKRIFEIFDQKWNQKQIEKIKRIQSFCVGTKEISIPLKKKREPEEQFSLDF